MSDNLEQALNELDSEELQFFAKRFLTPHLVSTQKADLISDLSSYLLSDDGLLQVWNSLSDLEKEVVRETIHGGQSDFNELKFKAKHGTIPRGLTSTDRYFGEISLLNLILFGATNFKPNTIPVELATKLKQFVEPPGPDTLKTSESLPDTVKLPDGSQQSLTCRKTEQNALNELHVILRLINDASLVVGAKNKRTSIAASRIILLTATFTRSRLQPCQKFNGSDRSGVSPGR